MIRTYGDGHLTLGGIRIECNITMRCNAICWGCNKAIGLASFRDGDMTVDQMRRAVDQLIEQKVKITRFTFCGGEPVLHRDLQELIDEVARLPGLHLGRVLTNDMPVTKHLRDKIRLPKRFRWVPNPLDDPSDPYSGKNDPTNRWKGRVHMPIWISPHDIGQEAKFENCTVRGWCGIGLDSTGFSMCGKAVMLGKLLGIDPTIKEGSIEEHIDKPIDDICKHCQYGIRDPKGMKRIAKRYKDGEYPDCEGGISPTFKKAFAQHKEQPLIQIGAY
jgi:hypothetical protein